MNHRLLTAGAAAFLLATGVTDQAFAEGADGAPLIVSASNATTNSLLVFSTAGALIQQIPTQGQGGVSGNAGGIAVAGNHVAAVNYGSSNVSLFVREGAAAALRLERVVPTGANPVSVAFGSDHLYVLTTTHVESHRIGPWGVAPTADGVAQLVLGDGSAAQVGVIKGQLILSEKNNAIERVYLTVDGAVTGAAALVANIPSNVNAPFGLATRGDEAYVTIAHANEISLVRNDTVLTVTGSGTQQAPCWVALDGPFLFSANSPSQSVSRYAVYGQKIVQDAAVVAQFVGHPTDIAYRHGFAAVVDGSTTNSRVTVFKVDQDGNFTTQGVATINSPLTNGVAIVGVSDER